MQRKPRIFMTLRDDLYLGRKEGEWVVSDRSATVFVLGVSNLSISVLFYQKP
jgi:hypothetical protein